MAAQLSIFTLSILAQSSEFFRAFTCTMNYDWPVGSSDLNFPFFYQAGCSAQLVLQTLLVQI